MLSTDIKSKRHLSSLELAAFWVVIIVELLRQPVKTNSINMSLNPLALAFNIDFSEHFTSD